MRIHLLPENHQQRQLEFLQQVMEVLGPVYAFLKDKEGKKTELFLGYDNTHGSEELLVLQEGELFIIDSGRGSQIRECRSKQRTSLQEVFKRYSFGKLYLDLTSLLSDRRFFSADGYRLDWVNEVVGRIEELINSYVEDKPVELRTPVANLSFAEFSLDRRSFDQGWRREFYPVLLATIGVWCPIHRLGACHGIAKFQDIQLADGSALGKDIFTLRTYASSWGGEVICRDCGSHFGMCERTMEEILYRASSFLVENGKRYELA